MELRQLRYFVETAERLNFYRSLAGPLTSRRARYRSKYRQLEQELRVPLFDRVSKRVYLTEAGSGFCRMPAEPCTTPRTAPSDCATWDVRTGELNIGVIYGLIAFLPRVVAAFSRSYPEVKINIAYHQTNNLYTMLRERRFDFALCYQSYEADDTFEVEHLFDTPCRW